MSCASLILGIHLLSPHIEPGRETFTPGVYASCDGVVAGALRNSQGKPSVYAGYTFNHDGVFGLTVAGATGYSLAPVIPVVVPSVKIGHVRVGALLPTRYSSAGVHFSLEMTWSP